MRTVAEATAPGPASRARQARPGRAARDMPGGAVPRRMVGRAVLPEQTAGATTKNRGGDRGVISHILDHILRHMCRRSVSNSVPLRIPRPGPSNVEGKTGRHEAPWRRFLPLGLPHCRLATQSPRRGARHVTPPPQAPAQTCDLSKSESLSFFGGRTTKMGCEGWWNDKTGVREGGGRRGKAEEDGHFFYLSTHQKLHGTQEHGTQEHGTQERGTTRRNAARVNAARRNPALRRPGCRRRRLRPAALRPRAPSPVGT